MSAADRVARRVLLGERCVFRVEKQIGDTVLGELGFDSLLYMELRNQLRQDLAIDMSVETFIGADVKKVVSSMYDEMLLQSLNVGGRSGEDLEELGDEDMEAFVL